MISISSAFWVLFHALNPINSPILSFQPTYSLPNNGLSVSESAGNLPKPGEYELRKRRRFQVQDGWCLTCCGVGIFRFVIQSSARRHSTNIFCSACDTSCPSYRLSSSRSSLLATDFSFFATYQLALASLPFSLLINPAAVLLRLVFGSVRTIIL